MRVYPYMHNQVTAHDDFFSFERFRFKMPLPERLNNEFCGEGFDENDNSRYPHHRDLINQWPRLENGMLFVVGDRVSNGSVIGTVEGVFGNSLWVLIDGQSSPITVANDGSIHLETPIVFEVGKNYKFTGGDGTIFHVVYKIDDDHFVVWFQPPNGGFQVSIATPPQRLQVVEV